MPARTIPPATLAAADHADPDWWEECAAWHEDFAGIAQQLGQGHEASAEYREDCDCAEEARYHSAAALACRAFALMMRRPSGEGDVRWRVDAALRQALWTLYGYPRSLPQAVADALQEEG
jgi:hypothetical protein